MNNLSADEIERLRKLFDEMNDSRKKLRPIMVEIIDALEKALFVDEEAAESNQLLLNKILDAQKEFFATEELRPAAMSKQLKPVDSAISKLEQECQFTRINKILDRIATLEVNSDAPEILAAVDQLKDGAEILKEKSGKTDAFHFAKLAEKFVLLTEIIDKSSATDDISTSDYLEIYRSFSDSPLIILSVTKNLLYFPQPVEAEPKPVEVVQTELFEEVPPAPAPPETEPEIEPPPPEPEPEPPKPALDPTKRAITGIKKKFDAIEPPPDLSLVLIDDADILYSGERGLERELPSVKSFGKKISKLLNGNDTRTVLSVLTNTKIFFREDPKNILVAGKLNEKLARFIPTVCEKLFSWGVVDKMLWRDVEFYFLNPAGLELCNRHLKTNVPASGSDYYRALINALREVMLFYFHRRFVVKFDFHSPYGGELPYIRAEALNSPNVALVFSLVLLDKNWQRLLAMFKLIIENEIKSGTENLEVVFLAIKKDDLVWLKIFNDTKFKKIRFLMFALDGLWAADGTELDLDTWEPKKIEPPPESIDDEPEPPPLPQIPSETKTETPIVKPPPSSDIDVVKSDFLRSAASLFTEGENARAMLVLYALKNHFAGKGDEEFWAEDLTREIGFILDDPLTTRALYTFDTFGFWLGVTENPRLNFGADYLNLAATIKVFYAPSDPTSFKIRKLWRQVDDDKSNAALKKFPDAKRLIKIFSDFTENTYRAFADCLDGAADTSENDSRAALTLIADAENNAENILHHDMDHRRIKYVAQQLFKHKGMVRKFLHVDEYSSDEILKFCRQFESVDLTGVIGEKSVTIDENIFSENSINDLLDEIWNTYDKLASRQTDKFIYNQKRRMLVRGVKQALIALVNYLHVLKKSEVVKNSSTQAAPVDKALEILENLQRQVYASGERLNLGQTVFRIFVDNFVKRLRGENVALSYSHCLLGAKYVELEEDFPSMASFGIEEFSLKNRAVAFEEDVSGRSFAENLQRAYDTAIRNYDFGILQCLQKYFPSSAVTVSASAFERNVDKQIERAYDNFRKDLELARTYARITDHEKIDEYINAVVDAREHFSETRNAGLFQRFIDACNAAIAKSAESQKNALIERLGTLQERLAKNLPESETLTADVRHQIELSNFTVAEDYMNRIENEGGTLLTNFDLIDSDLGTLNEFIAEHETLYNAITRSRGSIDSAYTKIQTSRSIKNHNTTEAQDFIRAWQSMNSGDNKNIETSIRVILIHLGYGDGQVIAQGSNSLSTQKSYAVTFKNPVRRNSYPHPFAIFGTEIYNRGLKVLYINAKSAHTPESIVQILASETADCGKICMINFALTLPERRKIAHLIKLDPNLKNILVIDLVMALYLTRFNDTNRGKKMLQVALPFARVQPYTSKLALAPEMFIGRSEELDKIRDMTGPVFVYGGRQLGKSSLLRQVRNIEHNPALANYAFFIDLKSKNCEQALERIVQELVTAKLIGEVGTWEDFEMEMRKLLSGQLRGVPEPKKLILLLDESDAFLSDPNIETAINILRQLLGDFQGKFKFVLAGLHKVIRFEKNSSFTNLNHISVLPFRASDAMELFIKPMSYLGFRVEDESLISAILSQTNYYPGLIQHYCQMLVEAVKDLYTARHFDATKNPPYPLNEDYLKNMLGNSDFQREIRQRFRDTLAVDDDNYYEILALAVAWIYYDNDDRPVSASLTEIRETCEMCGINKITDLSDAELLSLLDEMVELNLLRNVDGKFEFNRYPFRHMLGTAGEVEEKLIAHGASKS